ncbi:dihydrodipicolinate synthase family protein [Hungatella effluvii]|uniref:dihydrodipicolinate synthase family protein n=1 Tax=Hungatella effluvii TaxID=1096246 RepID=UPI0022E85FD2|nr:dihydrodipicolinate synthase family protein [Hungatella effluvii]
MGSLTGVNPPAVTVFNKMGLVDYDAMKQHADFMIEQGVSGIAYLGTSGEFGVMTLEQKTELIRVMTPYINHRVNVMAGVGDTCLDNTCRLMETAEEAGADAVLAVAPYFSVYAEENIEAYYRELSRYSKLPIIIYNFPALTGFDMTPDLVTKLAMECPNIMGIKDTVPETEHLLAMMEIKKKKPGFMVYCAYETQALELVQAGVDGFVNATSNFAPRFTVGLFQAALVQDEEEMQKNFNNMCRASEVYQYAEPLLLAVKEAVYQKVLHRNGTEKLPGLSLSTENKLKIHEILKTI